MEKWFLYITTNKPRKDTLYPKLEYGQWAGEGGRRKQNIDMEDTYFLGVVNCGTMCGEITKPDTCHGRATYSFTLNMKYGVFICSVMRHIAVPSQTTRGWWFLLFLNGVPAAYLRCVALGCPVIISCIKSSPQRANLLLQGGEYVWFTLGRCRCAVLLNMF